jgi:hypothetical protein
MEEPDVGADNIRTAKRKFFFDYAAMIGNKPAASFATEDCRTRS